jgi:hypothetical protein
MNLLRILALLGRGEQSSSEGMYEILVDCMKRADTGINVGYAIGKLFLLLTRLFTPVPFLSIFLSFSLSL